MPSSNAATRTECTLSRSPNTLITRMRKARSRWISSKPNLTNNSHPTSLKKHKVNQPTTSTTPNLSSERKTSRQFTTSRKVSV